MKNKMVRKVSLLALVAVIVMVTGGAVLYVGASDFNAEPTYVVAQEVEAVCCPVELVEEVAPLGDSINGGAGGSGLICGLGNLCDNWCSARCGSPTCSCQGTCGPNCDILGPPCGFSCAFAQMFLGGCNC